jgi:hypothetical protein
LERETRSIESGNTPPFPGLSGGPRWILAPRAYVERPGLQRERVNRHRSLLPTHGPIRARLRERAQATVYGRTAPRCGDASRGPPWPEALMLIVKMTRSERFRAVAPIAGATRTCAPSARAPRTSRPASKPSSPRSNTPTRTCAAPTCSKDSCARSTGSPPSRARAARPGARRGRGDVASRRSSGSLAQSPTSVEGIVAAIEHGLDDPPVGEEQDPAGPCQAASQARGLSA